VHPAVCYLLFCGSVLQFLLAIVRKLKMIETISMAAKCKLEANMEFSDILNLYSSIKSASNSTLAAKYVLHTLYEALIYTDYELANQLRNIAQSTK